MGNLMDDYEDYAREQWLNELYSDFSKEVLEGRDDLFGEVINKFTSERLQSYYMENPKVMERAIWALKEAQGLLAGHTAGSLVLAVAAAEVGLKSGLLKPILYGLVHDDAMAVVIAELIPEQRNDKFQKLLFGILKEYGGVDLGTYKRSGVAQTLWEEMQTTQKARNGVVHRAEDVSTDEAERGIAIATEIVNNIFPSVIAKLDLATTVSMEVQKKKRP